MTPEVKYRLMAPGPVMMPEAVYKSLSAPMVHHRTPEFTKTLQFVLDKLPGIFGSTQPVMMLSSTGSGAMEAAMINTCRKADKILVVTSGKFGQRWAEIAETYGIDADCLEIEWGHPVTLEQIQQAFGKTQYTALFCQATETSTGTAHPVSQIGEWLQQNSPKTLFAVDGITAVGATSLSMTEAHIDVLVAGSQKAFMLPAGLSFVCLSEKAWDRSKTSDLPKYYLDLSKELAANKKGQTFFSSNVSIISALAEVLKGWDGSGYEKHIQWCEKQSRLFKQFLTDVGIEIYSKSPSTTLTAFLAPKGMDGLQLRKHLEEKYKVTFMGGQEHLKGKILRMGHLGYCSADDFYASIYFLCEALKDLGFSTSTEAALHDLRQELNL